MTHSYLRRMALDSGRVSPAEARRKGWDVERLMAGAASDHLNGRTQPAGMEKDGFFAAFDKEAEGRVFAYRNIRKSKDTHVYSVRGQGGKVEQHTSDMTLTNPKWKVSAAGNQRVRKSGVKNVHAGVEGDPAEVDHEEYDWHPVTYDPKKHTGFVARATGAPVDDPDAVHLTPGGVLAGFKKAAFWLGFTKAAAEKNQYSKRPYGELDIHTIDPADDSEAWTAKIDGAHTVIEMTKGEVPLLFSHRISKKTGGQIPYNAKLPHISRPSPVTGLFRGETYAVDQDGRAVHPDVVTALLNSGAEKSLELQRRLGIQTKTALIDVDHHEGEAMHDAPFGEKRALLERIVAANPDFTLPAMATSAESKQALRKQIVDGDHPQTKEGLVVHKIGEPGKFGKAKITNDHDVYVREIFHEEPTKEGRTKGMAGGFAYSWEPDGPVAGKVGTGFDHATKKDMAANPQSYVGKVARVKALAVSKNKALMKPSFLGWHVDKNLD